MTTDDAAPSYAPSRDDGASGDAAAAVPTPAAHGPTAVGAASEAGTSKAAALDGDGPGDEAAVGEGAVAAEPATGGDAAREKPAKTAGAWRSGWRRVPFWGKVAGTLGGFVVVVLLVTAFVVQPFVIPSGSMADTLHVGDRVVVDKLSYRFGGAIHRGDVVVFDGTGSFLPDATEPTGIRGFLQGIADDLGFSGSRDFVKRVVGVGGDRVRCCDATGRITVNGRAVEEPYLYPGDAPSTDPFDIEVPAGSLFVLGDHRSSSEDSRDLLGSPGGGFVPTSRVLGRVVAVIWPFSDIRTVSGAAQLRAVPSLASGTVPIGDGIPALPMSGAVAAAGLLGRRRRANPGFGTADVASEGVRRRITGRG